MAVRIRRAYDAPLPEDGRRVLVERLWPRGMKKERLFINAWLKELAPSDELRRWFGHDPERWQVFQRRYRDELRAIPQQRLLDELAQQASARNVTLIYSSREERFNNAVALKEIIEERMHRRVAARMANAFHQPGRQITINEDGGRLSPAEIARHALQAGD